MIFDPETGETIVAAQQTPLYFFSIFLPKKQYVGQLEALAALAAYTTAAAYRPGMFLGREVVHFVDNTSVIAGLRKGYSSRPDTALILISFWLLITILGCNPWFEYVPSKLNIADLPSRGDTPTLLDTCHMTEIPFILPPQDMWHAPIGEWYNILRIAFAKPTRTARRALARRKRARGK